MQIFIGSCTHIIGICIGLTLVVCLQWQGHRQRLIKKASIELCGVVHTVQRQRPMRLFIVFCTQFISICISLSLGIVQCE